MAETESKQQKFLRTQQFLGPLTGKVKPRQFATYDLETTTDLERVYLIGFYDGMTYRYFESKPSPPDKVGGAVDAFCQWLFKETSKQYSKTWLYAHNGGNFDALYIIRWLLTHAEEHGLSFSIIPIQSTVLSLNVWRRGEDGIKKNYHWKLIDSNRLIPGTLESLGRAFGLGGKIDKIDYETLHLDPRRYEYLERDCRLLYDVVGKFYDLIWSNGGEVGITAPSTAMATFRRKFLSKPISVERHFPGCLDQSCRGCLHELIRKAYYGGRTEVFRSNFDGPGTLNYYDVNSMYPNAMLSPMPVELAAVKTTPVDIDFCARHWAGFVEATVTVPKSCYAPPLPYRHGGKLIFPTGTFRGVWSSLELQCAQSIGTKIEQHRSVWYRTRPIFGEFIEHWYKCRDKSLPGYDPALSIVAKLLMNSLYGKFGTNEEREKLWFFPDDIEFTEHKLRPMGLESIFSGAYLETTRLTASYVIPQISAWITSLARVLMWRLLIDAKDVYYCDTDSIVTSTDMQTSPFLGGLKLEGRMRKAIFAAPKLYYADWDWHIDGLHESVKAKGFGGFGKKFDKDAFMRLTQHHEKVTVQRIRKMREGLRRGKVFPAMKVEPKGLSKHQTTKRTQLSDGNTTPIVIGVL